ncbi:MAG TPA: hypothetical protein VNJ29_00675 [Candidatus Nitrosotenuis sp.]|jgi:hypothetical protein|nr:hypothetical protein [Candidatus Nitrosotenuis sp.]
MFNPFKALSLNLTIGLLSTTFAFSADNSFLVELKSSKLFTGQQEKLSHEVLLSNQSVPKHRSISVIHTGRSSVPIRHRGLRANHNINILLLNGCGGTVPLPDPLIFYTPDGKTIKTGLRKLTVGPLLGFESILASKDTSIESLPERSFKNHAEFKTWLDDIADGKISSQE